MFYGINIKENDNTANSLVAIKAFFVIRRTVYVGFIGNINIAVTFCCTITVTTKVVYNIVAE